MKAIDFWKEIPREIGPNIKKRLQLQKELAKSESARDDFLQLCYEYPPIFFDLLLFTYNPRNRPGKRDVPFILRPAQVDAVVELNDGIINGIDKLIDKSRDEGATEIVIKLYLLHWLLIPQSSLLVGSRKEELVDRGTSVNYTTDRVYGDHKCLFHKFLYGLVKLPTWFRPPINKTHMEIQNLANGSNFSGEATNPNFGAGDRRTSVYLDEFGRLDPKLANDIRNSINDVTDCVIYGSTHFYGRGHPFAKLRFSRTIDVITLPWWKNPVKNEGLYKSPKAGLIEIHDIDYWKKLYPKAFFKDVKRYEYNKLEQSMLINYPEINIKLNADGLGNWRSPWYDREDFRRDPRDVAQNIDMNPVGAGDTFFDPIILQQIQSKIKPPDFIGDVDFKQDSKGKIYGVKFIHQGGRKEFKWWGDLPYGKPNQNHNYIVGCDISLGVGTSNSVASIHDVNTGEKVGIFVTPYLAPEEFCDKVIAICYWVGGMTGKPYLIWEANGPGHIFDKRRKFHQYGYVYFNTQERRGSKKRTKQPGWYSTKVNKFDALLDLRTALSAGVSDIKSQKKLTVYDSKTLEEYEDYIFYENGDIGLTNAMEDSPGAKAGHGDRVIADAVCVVAMGEQRKAAMKRQAKLFPGSFAFRRWLRGEERHKEKENSIW